MLHGKRLLSFPLMCIAAISALAAAPAAASENSPGQSLPAGEQLAQLRLDNQTLAHRVKELEDIEAVSVEHLHRKKTQRLKEIAADVKLQRQTASDFEGFVTWMSANLAGYNRYIKAGSYAAVAARMLPIPYAGQASTFTTFVAQFTLALNAASVSITAYLDSSQRFVVMADAIDPHRPHDEKAVADAAQFADQRLVRDMGDVQAKLASLSDLSAGALSFLESIDHYAGGTDEYWNKMKGVFKKDIDHREKSLISESTRSLRNQADRFNARLRSFGELAQKETAGVNTLAVYDELAAEAVSIKPQF
ncbi:MAG TPA: hypothetical protein VF795_06960 [Desulfuromonadaceae bacterium]